MLPTRQGARLHGGRRDRMEHLLQKLSTIELVRDVHLLAEAIIGSYRSYS